MANKKQVISQTRHKMSADGANKEMTRKQRDNRGVNASFLILEGISILDNQDELFSLVKNIVNKHSNWDEDMKMTIDKKSDCATYEMVEKDLCMTIARSVKKAFKHYNPQMEIHNPEDNVFYRIKVRFGVE